MISISYLAFGLIVISNTSLHMYFKHNTHKSCTKQNLYIHVCKCGDEETLNAPKFITNHEEIEMTCNLPRHSSFTHMAFTYLTYSKMDLQKLDTLRYDRYMA
jgi:hypothetical protein